MTPNTQGVIGVPVRPGQTRRDAHGGSIFIAGETPSRRWIVRYPAAGSPTGYLSTASIQQLYPFTTDDPRGTEAVR